ncbi:MAG: dihydroorotate dehydrogenase (quinone) [Pseudomonadota bacterium]
MILQNFSEGKHPLVAHAVAGINIGKNATTDINDAQFDYVAALQRVYAKADYVTVNISSPNTSSLRDLQNANYLDDLLLQIKQARDKCAKVHKREVPVALKVAPDLEDVEIETIAELVMSHRLDAVIATNTTTARPSTLQSSHAAEPGGLSGQPVKDASTQVIKKFYQQLQGRVSIIGVGGIATPDDAWEKLLAGADYLQVYSMFIYEGPLMIRNIVEGLKSKVERAGYTSLQEALSELRTRA